VESEAAGLDVAENDSASPQAVSDYKQVATHYLPERPRRGWPPLTPVIDLTDIMLRYEFGKSPGGIFHGVGFSQSEMDQRLDEALSQLGRTVDGAVKKVE
jgi:hypothetical protein